MLACNAMLTALFRNSQMLESVHPASDIPWKPIAGGRIGVKEHSGAGFALRGHLVARRK